MYLSRLGAARIYLGNSDSLSEAQARASCPGIFSREAENYQPGMPQIAKQIDAFYCTPIAAPATTAPPPAPVPITVTTSTQVSPQISPTLVQQDQPTNSPVTSAPNQSAPATQSGSGGGVSADDMRRMQADAAAQRQDDWNRVMDLFKASRPESAGQSPIIQVPAYTPVASTTGFTSADDSITIPTPLGPSTVPVDTFNRYAPWVAGILIVGAVWYSKRRKQ